MSLARVLNQTAYVAAQTGVDSYGKPTYGTPAAKAVRVQQKRTLVTNARGDEVTSSHRLWCQEEIALTSRVWLPGVSASTAEPSYLPIAVSSVSDFVGAKTLYAVDL